MSSEAIEPRPPRRTGRSGRPRFVLPADHHEETASDRTGARIEAFLEGPPRARRTRPLHLRQDGLRRPRPALPLDTRVDWNLALRVEEARVARYGRPATILVVDIGIRDPDRTDALVRRIGTLLRRYARETDRVTRAAPTRFHVLMPETTEPDAVGLVERVRRAALGPGGDLGGAAEIHAAAVCPIPGQTLVEALRVAEDRLAA